MIKLGQTVRDTVTGHEGTATVKAEYLGGQVRYCVEPRSTDGKASDSPPYFDQARLQPVE